MIAQGQLEGIKDYIDTRGELSEALIADLRQQFDGVHFTFCCDDDIAGTQPVFEQENYNLYLIDSRNHCLCFTQDFAIATGVVVAEVEEE